MIKQLFFSIIILILFGFNASAQDGWVNKSNESFSIEHPTSWKQMNQVTDTNSTLMMEGKTPFKESKRHLGTILYITKEKSNSSSINIAAIAYKEKLQKSDFLTNLQILKETVINFNGMDAVEYIFKATVQDIPTECRIVIFLNGGNYYEVSVTYDQRLDKKLIAEAYQVIDSFKISK